MEGKILRMPDCRDQGAGPVSEYPLLPHSIKEDGRAEQDQNARTELSSVEGR